MSLCFLIIHFLQKISLRHIFQIWILTYCLLTQTHARIIWSSAQKPTDQTKIKCSLLFVWPLLHCLFVPVALNTRAWCPGGSQSSRCSLDISILTCDGWFYVPSDYVEENQQHEYLCGVPCKHRRFCPHFCPLNTNKFTHLTLIVLLSWDTVS